MKRYWNYSTDHQPRHPYNWGDVKNLYKSERAAARACKAWCKSERLDYDDDMVAEVTDFVS